MSDEKSFAERGPEDIPEIVYESPMEAIPAFIDMSKNGILNPENFQLQKQGM